MGKWPPQALVRGRRSLPQNIEQLKINLKEKELSVSGQKNEFVQSKRLYEVDGAFPRT